MDDEIRITRTESLTLLSHIRDGELAPLAFLDIVKAISTREEISTGEVLARTKDVLLRGIGHYASQGGSPGTIGRSITIHS